MFSMEGWIMLPRERTIAFLTSSTAIVTVSVAWALGLLAGATLSVKGAAAQEPQQIPLEYVYGSYNYNGAEQHYVSRLGIWVGIGDGKAQRFLFDTGSDQFNAAIGKDANVNDIAGAPKNIMSTMMEPMVTSSNLSVSISLPISIRTARRPLLLNLARFRLQKSSTLFSPRFRLN
ncbi:hypothetical protein HED50_21835 [Ochrobactrum oryzae]|nr:hypothetical protein [Brucella oryzae]